MTKKRNILHEAGKELTTEFAVLTRAGAPYDLSWLFKDAASRLRQKGSPETAYTLWRSFGLVNPRNRAAGSIGGTTAVANMTREERRIRARKGGNRVFHGDHDGTDGVRASARGRLLAARRWRSR